MAEEEHTTAQRLAWPALAGVLTALGLLSPLILLGASGLAISGLAEESTGYRYFYTLRMLYGEDEIPWIPQGQLPGIAHMAIQLGLSLVGVSPATLHPRIDIFAYAAAALPHALAGLTLAWMAAALPVRARAAAVASAGLMVVVSLPSRTGWGYTAVLPDYLTWAEPIGLIMAGWLLRLMDDRRREKWTSDIRLGVFTGLCLAIKPTYVVFAIPIAVLVAFVRKPRRVAALALSSSVIIAGGTWLMITWAYYLGSVSATVSHFVNLQTYIAAISSNLSLREWLFGPQLWNSFDATNLALLMPIGLLTTTLFHSHKYLSVALLLGSLLSLYVAYRRFEFQTLVEVNAYFAAALIVWSVAVVGPKLARVFDSAGMRRSTAHLALTAISAALWGLVAREIWIGERTLVPAFANANYRGTDVAQCLMSTSGKTLFLIPDNSLRPVTVDSAIFKGGTDIYRYYWGVSKLVRDMFPDRGYLYGNTSPPITPTELAGYSKILFVSLPGRRRDADEGVTKTFGISPDDFECSCAVDFGYHVVNVCYR